MDSRTDFEDTYSSIPSAGSSFSASPSHYQPFTPPSNRIAPHHEPTIHIDHSYSAHHPSAMSFGMSPSPLPVQSDDMKHDMVMYEPRYQDTRYGSHLLPMQQNPQQQYPSHHLDMTMNPYGSRPYDVHAMAGPDQSQSHHQGPHHTGVDSLSVMSPYGHPGMPYAAPMSKSGSISSMSSGGLSPCSPAASTANGPAYTHQGMTLMSSGNPTPRGSTSQTSVESLLNTSPSPNTTWMPHMAPRHMYMGAAQSHTNMLRHAQDYPHPMAPHMHQTSSHLRNNGIEVQNVSKPGHACEYPGCTKAFKRAEHLKRHHSTAHNANPTWQTCPFCPSTRRFLSSRIDNYRQHIRLHTIRTKSPQSRVGYHEGAASLLREIESQMKRRGVRKNRDTDDMTV